MKHSPEFKFIHAADIHLDGECKIINPLYAEMPVDLKSLLFDYTRRAFCNLVDLCLSENVDFMILSGDVFDKCERSVSSQLFFKRQMERLNKKGINVYICFGNHDYVNPGFHKITYPSNVHLFDCGKVEKFSFIKNGIPLANIYGISFDKREIKDNLTELFPKTEKDNSFNIFNIGVLHTNVGSISEHKNYSPCNLNDLIACNIDYWALGHVHSRKILKKNNPLIAYSGNIQGRGFHEEGNKGCYLAHVKDNAVCEFRFLSTDEIRWKTIRINIETFDSQEFNQSDDVEKLMCKIAEIVLDNIPENKKTYIVNIVLEGKSEIHKVFANPAIKQEDLFEELERKILCYNDEKISSGEICRYIWINSFKIQTQLPIDKKNLVDSGEFISQFLAVSDNVIEQKGHHKLVNEVLKVIESNRDIQRYLDDFSEEELTELINNAQSMGIDLLLLEED